MKHFSQRLICWLFATMTPAFNPPTTIDARETIRKRRLFSVIVLVSFLALSLITLEGILTRAPLETQIQNVWACAAILIAGWLNQRRGLKCASLFYLLATFFELAMIISIQSLYIPVLSFSLWPALLTLIVAAQFFLPAWGPLLPGAVAAKKAVIQAGREIEAEHHQDLAQAYTDQETAHTSALTDVLTGLPNHRAVMDQLEKELDRARRDGRPFSLLRFDADSFKHVNGTYGHSTGDAALRQIGERVSSILREGDTLGHFGKEEFVVLLPEVDASEASTVAERIRATIASRPIATAGVAEGILMSVSIGISTYPADGDMEKDLLQQADDAMCLAKRLGHNQVRTTLEDRQASADAEIMLLLQEAKQGETLEQQGQNPEQAKESYILKIISSLMFSIEQRDPEMKLHSHRVRDLATAMAQELALEPDEVFKIGAAALLHDIGKVSLPDALLQKAGFLSLKEQKLLREHPQLGALILQTNPLLHDLMPIVLHHHERWDGTGYPQQLAGEQIPLGARIIAAAESFDVMMRGHPYQVSHTPRQALAEMHYGAGTQFDPRIVGSLLDVLTQQQKSQQATHGLINGAPTPVESLHRWPGSGSPLIPLV